MQLVIEETILWSVNKRLDEEQKHLAGGLEELRPQEFFFPNLLSATAGGGTFNASMNHAAWVSPEPALNWCQE